MSDLILYTSDDGRAQVQLRAHLGTVWLTQLEMAELFNASKQNISLHLKNLFQDGELDEVSVVKESLTVQTAFLAGRIRFGQPCPHGAAHRPALSRL